MTIKIDSAVEPGATHGQGHRPTQLAASTHATSFLATASEDMGGPAATRDAFLGLGDRVAELASSSPALRDSIVHLEQAMHTQIVSSAAARAGDAAGYPAIPGLPHHCINLVYAVGRLNAHNLMSQHMSGPVDSVVGASSALEVAVPSGDDLAVLVRKVATDLEPGFVDHLLQQTAAQMRQDQGLVDRVAAAGSDVGQIVNSGQVPHYLVQHLAEWEATHGAGSTDRVAADLSSAHARHTADTGGWVRPGTLTGPSLMPSDPTSDDSWDTPTGAEAESAAGAVVCTVAGAATGGVGLVICVVVVVAIIVISIILSATGSKP